MRNQLAKSFFVIIAWLHPFLLCSEASAYLPHVAPELHHTPLGRHSYDSLDPEKFAADEEWFDSYLQSGSCPSRPVDCLSSPFEEPAEAVQQKSFRLKTQNPPHPDTALFISTPGWDDEIENPSASFKRIALDQSDGPFLKKHKQATEKIDDNNQENGLPAFKSSIESNHKFSILHRSKSSVPIVQTDKGTIISFDVNPSELKKFALVSTLNFPGSRVCVYPSVHQKLLVNKEFWNYISAPGSSWRLQPLIQDMIQSTQASEKNSIIMAHMLLDEIFFRNSQFLIAFTSPARKTKLAESYGISSEEIRRLRINEQNKLFDWLKKLFMNGIQSQASFSTNPQDSNERLYSFESLQKNVSAYFKCDMESEEKTTDRWVKEAPRGNVRDPVMVNESMAIRTKIAIAVLVNYYKSTDQETWKYFFQQDSYFLNLFAFLKQREQSKNADRLYDINLIKWEAFKLFPWGRPKASVKDVDAKDINRFWARISKFNWNWTESYFKNIEGNSCKKSVPEKIQF